jgi:uncharacterized protein YbjT (DUF2867 family)
MSSAPAPKKIIVFGATGVIGKYIIGALIDAKLSFEKIGIFTSSATAADKKELLEAWKSQGVEIIVGSVDIEPDVRAALKGKSSLSIELPRGLASCHTLCSISK